jgi:coenzyme F420-reducing hydrogenase alpha subunit
VALRHPDEYPMNEGRLVSSRGLDIAAEQYAEHFEEYQVPYSNALHSRRRAQANGAFFVGPLARWNLNADRVPAIVQQAAKDTGIAFPNRNPFVSIVVRALELVLAFEEALRLIAQYEPPVKPAVDFQPRAGVGEAITEAPRGILYHRYATDASGTITQATIVPPTSQNQLQIEHDLKRIAPRLVNLPEPEAALEAERVVRNYDPCISCATHFLKLRVDRQ